MEFAFDGAIFFDSHAIVNDSGGRLAYGKKRRFCEPVDKGAVAPVKRPLLWRHAVRNEREGYGAFCIDGPIYRLAHIREG